MPPKSMPAPPLNLRPPESTPAAKSPEIVCDSIAQPPPRCIVNAVAGWGKTTLGAFAPSPLIVMAEGEEGYLDLLGSGLVPNVPRATVTEWQSFLALLDQVIADPGKFRTVVLDALGGFESLCHEHVCKREFNGDWGEKGFNAFRRGHEISVREWLVMLQRLDRLNAKGLTVIGLSHARVKTFNNPLGENFDRYETDLHPKTWGVTDKWASMILFGTFDTTVDKVDKVAKKGKATGGKVRIVKTTRTDAYEAKNRYGMPPEIVLPEQIDKGYEEIFKHLKREGGLF